MLQEEKDQWIGVKGRLEAVLTLFKNKSNDIMTVSGLCILSVLRSEHFSPNPGQVQLYIMLQ